MSRKLLTCPYKSLLDACTNLELDEQEICETLICQVLLVVVVVVVLKANDRVAVVDVDAPTSR